MVMFLFMMLMTVRTYRDDDSEHHASVVDLYMFVRINLLTLTCQTSIHFHLNIQNVQEGFQHHIQEALNKLGALVFFRVIAFLGAATHCQTFRTKHKTHDEPCKVHQPRYKGDHVVSTEV